MPANQQTSSYVDQLREMRTTRMQQLRQGGQQSSLMNKQISVLGSLNTTMNSVLKGNQQQLKFTKDSIDQQKTLVKQTSDMTKSITNLSSSLARTVGGLAAAVGRGAVSAGSSVGGAAVSGASSIASGVASAVVKTLPFAIAGVLGKVLLWDNMSSDTQQGLKKSVGDLFGRVFEGAGDSKFGKMINPIIDQFKVVFAALGDTLEGVMNSITKKVEDLFGKIELKFDDLKKVVDNIGKSVEDLYKNTKPLIDDLKRVSATTRKFVEGTKEASEYVLPTVVGVGAVAAGVGASRITQNKPSTSAIGAQPTTTTSSRSLKTQTTPTMMSSERIASMSKALEYLKTNGMKYNKQNLLIARVFVRALSVVGKSGKAFVEAVTKYKLSRSFFLVGLAVEIFGWAWVRAEILQMQEEDILNDEEADSLLNLAKNTSISSVVGGIIGGALGALGGLVAGPVGSAVGGVGGSVAGSMAGQYIAESFTALPKSLTDEIDTKKFRTAHEVANANLDIRRSADGQGNQDKIPRQGVEKTKDTVSSAMDRIKQSVSGKGKSEVGTEKAAVEFFMSRGWTKEQAAGIVGNLVAESNLKTDAVGDSGKAYGIAQWHPDRQERFKQYKNKDIKESSFQEQLEFVDWELRNTEKVAGDVIKNTKTAFEAAAMVDKFYERSKGLHRSKRIAIAERLMKDHFNTTMMASAETGSATGPSAGPSTSFFENYKRRSEEMKAAEQPKLTREEEKAKNLQDLKDMASGSSVWKELGRIGNIYKQTTEDLEKGSETMSKGGSGALVVDSSDKSVTNIVNNSAGGGGGGVSFNPVYPGGFNQTRTQFNSMAGMMLA